MEKASIEEARKALGEIVDRARLTGEPTIITRHGKPAALMVSVHARVTLPDGTEVTGLDLWHITTEGESTDGTADQ